MRARVGGASTTSFLLAAHFAKRNTKFGGGGKIGIGKRWRAKIPSPQPPARLATRSVAGRPSFLPAQAFSLAPRSCGAVSSVQKRFGFGQTNAPISNFPIFARSPRKFYLKRWWLNFLDQNIAILILFLL